MTTNGRMLQSLGLLLVGVALVASCAHGPAAPPVSSEVEEGLQARQLYAQGMGAYRAHDYEAAVPLFQQAVQLEPSMDEATAALAWSQYYLGDYRLSTYYFRQALSRQPRWKDLHDGLGWSRYRLGRFNLAIQAFQQAIGLDPQYRDAQIGLAFSQFQMGRYADAQPQLELLIREGEGDTRKSPAPVLEEVRSRLAWTLFYLKRYDRAAEEFHRGIGASPNAYGLYDGLGWTYLALGQPELARQHFEQALRLKPDFRDAQAGFLLARQ